MKHKPVSLWRGKPLDTYNKTELIEIIEQLGKMYQQSSQEHIRQLNLLQTLTEKTK